MSENNNNENDKISPVNESMLRQIKCPSEVPTKIKPYESIEIILGDLLPEATGYVVGYQITGLGSIDSKKITDRMGFTGNENERVLGNNYFIKTNRKCNEFSSDKCKNQDNYMYVRNIPTNSFKGNMTNGLLQDLYDITTIPVELVNSYKTNRGKFSATCNERTLPVGNSFNNKNRSFKSLKEYQSFVSKCITECEKYRNNNKQKFSNCLKGCKRGNYIETRCTSVIDKYPFETFVNEYKNNNEYNKISVKQFILYCFFFIFILSVILLTLNKLFFQFIF